MGYHITTTDYFLQELDKKIETQYHSRILKKINKNLEHSPKGKGKIIGVTKLGLPAFELRLIKEGIRIYFTIIEATITIEDIEYDGRSIVDSVGLKKHQKKDIKTFKKRN